MHALDRTSTVANIVLDHPECARVFRRHHIDFCCHGDVTVADACAGHGVDADALVVELGLALTERAPWDADPRPLSTPDLVELIISRHHDYLRQVLPFVTQLAGKVARVHAQHDARLPALADAVNGLAAAFVEHIDEEERSLFPLVVVHDPDLDAVTKELRTMEAQHVELGDALGRIRMLADDYAMPEWACPSYHALVRQLEAIESDTFVHVQKENHVLLPRFVGSPTP